MRMSVTKAVILVSVGVLVGGGTFATAATLLTSKDIKDGAIQNRDIRTGAITMSRLSESTQELIREGGPRALPGHQEPRERRGPRGRQAARFRPRH